METRLLVSSSWFLGGCGSMWVQKTPSPKENGKLGQCIMAGVEYWLVWALSSRMVEQVALPCASVFLKSVCPSLRPAGCDGGFGSQSVSLCPVPAYSASSFSDPSCVGGGFSAGSLSSQLLISWETSLDAHGAGVWSDVSKSLLVIA